jgi:hypothetical protein
MIIWAPPSKCANFPPFLKEDAISILAFSGPQRDGREAPGAMVSDLMDLAAEGRERYRPMSTKTSDLVQRTIWADENDASSRIVGDDAPNFTRASRSPAGAVHGDRIDLPKSRQNYFFSTLLIKTTVAFSLNSTENEIWLL